MNYIPYEIDPINTINHHEDESAEMRKYAELINNIVINTDGTDAQTVKALSVAHSVQFADSQSFKEIFTLWRDFEYCPIHCAILTPDNAPIYKSELIISYHLDPSDIRPYNFILA